MTDFDLVRQFAGILIVLGVLAGIVYLFGRRRPGTRFRLPGSRRGTGRMEVVDRLYLTPNHSLHLVRMGRRGLLLSLHPGGCNLVETGPLEQFGAERETV